MKKSKAIFISSCGGHLTQLFQLKSIIDKYDSVIITEKNEITKEMSKKNNMKYLKYCSRKKILTFPFLFLYNVIKSFYYLLKYNPKYIITTGAGTAVPICYLGKLFGKKIVYIESYARINSPSLSGRMVYKIASLFIVQRESMKQFYPKAKCLGSIY